MWPAPQREPNSSHTRASREHAGEDIGGDGPGKCPDFDTRSCSAYDAGDRRSAQRIAPLFERLLDDGKIEYRKVGTHRRVRFEALLTYKKKVQAERLAVLNELAAYDQELGI